MKFPTFDFDPDTDTGTLIDGFDYETGITGTVAAVSHCLLANDGRLSFRAGYCWNFGSGPAINTPEMVAASLPHDGLYDLIAHGELDMKHRKDADKYFRKLLKDYGVGWFRRNYCYWGVRAFGGSHAKSN